MKYQGENITEEQIIAEFDLIKDQCKKTTAFEWYVKQDSLPLGYYIFTVPAIKPIEKWKVTKKGRVYTYIRNGIYQTCHITQQ